MINAIGNNVLEMHNKALSQHIQHNKLLIYVTITHYLNLSTTTHLYSLTICCVQYKAVRRRSQFNELGPFPLVLFDYRVSRFLHREFLQLNVLKHLLCERQV